MDSKKTILVLDSGIGGLSILDKINKIIPSNINYIYIMDNKGFPYSNKKYSYIINRIITIIEYLSKEHKIILLIIACNTASIILLKYIKKKFNFKIITTLPNINKAIQKTNNNIIGLIATFITVNSNYIKKKIKKIPSKIIFLKKYSYKLINQAEEKIKNNIINISKIKKIFKNWINLKNQPDTIIIGCTHFEFLKKEIQKVFNKKIKFVNNIKNIIKKTKKYISNINIIKTTKKQKKIFFYTKKTNFSCNFFFY